MNPELDFHIGIVEPTRQDADYGVRLSVKMDLLTDNRPVPAEPPLEKTPREHHGIPIRAIFALGEGASNGSVHAEHRKKIPTSAASAHLLRQFSAFSGQCGIRVAQHRHILKAMGLSAPVVKIGWSNWIVVKLLRVDAGVAKVLVDHDQPVRIAKRKGLQQD